ncbi:MAG: CYTH domain-containing protein [Candidatus Gracilibacteria bacterium]|nr:CYTH domain-containing protein [Candidatus Gracilibacteria bacterium]
MLEKEIKILEINKEEICKKLDSLGAEKTFEGYIHDIYYDFVEGENMKMEENKRLFRVRQKGETHLYTIKRKRNKKSDGGEDGVKIADEGENIITDVDSFKKVLEKYGMSQTREKKKHRTSYRLNGVEFDIDDYDSIPTLLEIEAKTVEEIKEYVKILGLEKHIQKDFGSRKLYEYYGLDYSYL